MPSIDGLVHLKSSRSVAEIVGALEVIIYDHDLTIFARIDHSAAAAEAGLKMPPTVLLIFGNPTSGTPLMLASPTMAIDLPLKVLIWQAADGQVWLTYNSTLYLQKRHQLPEQLVRNIAGIESICQAAVR